MGGHFSFFSNSCFLCKIRKRIFATKLALANYIFTKVLTLGNASKVIFLCSLQSTLLGGVTKENNKQYLFKVKLPGDDDVKVLRASISVSSIIFSFHWTRPGAKLWRYEQKPKEFILDLFCFQHIKYLFTQFSIFSWSFPGLRLFTNNLLISSRDLLIFHLQ